MALFRLFFRNHMLAISSIVLVIGLALSAVAWFHDALLPSDLDARYIEFLQPSPSKNWNRVVQIVGPVVLLVGGWYFGEQVYYRRKFHKLLDVEHKSEFQKNRRRLDEVVIHLPKDFEGRIEARETDFKSRR